MNIINNTVEAINGNRVNNESMEQTSQQSVVESLNQKEKKGIVFNIPEMLTTQPKTYDNQGAHDTLKQMMQKRINLNIKFYTDQNGYANLWIESKNVTGFKYILNKESLSWIYRYLISGEYDDSRVNPSDYEVYEEGKDFQMNILTGLIESGKQLQFVPLFRESPSYISATASFLRGKMFFRIKRDDELIEYLKEKANLI